MTTMKIAIIKMIINIIFTTFNVLFTMFSLFPGLLESHVIFTIIFPPYIVHIFSILRIRDNDTTTDTLYLSGFLNQRPIIAKLSSPYRDVTQAPHILVTSPLIILAFPRSS